MSPVVYVIPAYFLLAGTVFLLLAAFSDPGIVPRGKPTPEGSTLSYLLRDYYNISI